MPLSAGRGPLRRPRQGPSQPPPAPPRAPIDWRWLVVQVGLMLLLLWGWQELFSRGMVRTIPYSEFKDFVAKGQVIEAAVSATEITGRIDPGRIAAPAKPAEPAAQRRVERPSATPAPAGEKSEVFMFRTIRVEDQYLVAELQGKGVAFTGTRPNALTQFVLQWLAPIALMVFFWFLLSRAMGQAGTAVMGFGKSRAKLVTEKETGVSFSDVAGCEEAKYELQEVVDFLMNPKRYQALGAKIPKGVLLVGPPGTGKTLLARAVAGEAKAPFFSLSGSDFVEMFVGVGAARVRDLFQQAKAQAPCIVFIDELDAIGRQRGVHVNAGGHDEREQTLNALLVEMDGFDPNAGVVILSATNRPEVLDRALLRPGRFDRQVIVDSPDLEGREAILRVHSRGKPLSEGVDMREIAQATPGFSGADLANLLNEGALLAARRRVRAIEQQDLREALEKVIAGPERRSRRLNEDDKRRVAYHEVGHALVAAHSGKSDPVRKISVVPRGRAALGYTLQLPTEQQFLMTKSGILDRIRGLLGGRAAEELIFGEVTTGAENDLERATAMARQMVCIYGMSDKAGLARTVHRQLSPYLVGPDGEFTRDCSEETAEMIDHEVKKILDRCYAEAKEILSAHRNQVEQVTAELLKHETLDGDAFYKLIGMEMPRPVERERAETATAEPVAVG